MNTSTLRSMKNNWRIAKYENGSFIEFLDELGEKVIFTRKLYGFKINKINELLSEMIPDFELFEDEKITRTFWGDIWILKK